MAKEIAKATENLDPHLLSINEFNSYYKKGLEEVSTDDEQKYNYLEQKAYFLVDNHSSNILTVVGHEQLLDVYTIDNVEKDEQGNEISREVGRKQYGPLFYLKKAVAAQINYWLQNGILEEYARQRETSDSFSSYTENKDDFQTILDTLCKEAQTFIQLSGVNQTVAINGYDYYTDQETINNLGFAGMFADSIITGKTTIDYSSATLDDIIRQYLQWKAEKAQNTDEIIDRSLFAQTFTQSLTTTLNNIKNTDDIQSQKIAVINNLLALINAYKQDAIVQTNIPRADQNGNANIALYINYVNEVSGEQLLEIKNNNELHFKENIDALKIDEQLKVDEVQNDKYIERFIQFFNPQGVQIGWDLLIGSRVINNAPQYVQFYANLAIEEWFVLLGQPKPADLTGYYTKHFVLSDGSYKLLQDPASETRVIFEVKQGNEIIETIVPSAKGIELEQPNKTSPTGLATNVEDALIDITSKTATKGYVNGLDGGNMKLTGDQTISGLKTFTGFVEIENDPIYPYDAANKHYVDALRPPYFQKVLDFTGTGINTTGVDIFTFDSNYEYEITTVGYATASADMQLKPNNSNSGISGGYWNTFGNGSYAAFGLGVAESSGSANSIMTQSKLMQFADGNVSWLSHCSGQGNGQSSWRGRCTNNINGAPMRFAVSSGTWYGRILIKGTKLVDYSGNI